MWTEAQRDYVIKQECLAHTTVRGFVTSLNTGIKVALPKPPAHCTCFVQVCSPQVGFTFQVLILRSCFRQVSHIILSLSIFPLLPALMAWTFTPLHMFTETEREVSSQQSYRDPSPQNYYAEHYYINCKLWFINYRLFMLLVRRYRALMRSNSSPSCVKGAPFTCWKVMGRGDTFSGMWEASKRKNHAIQRDRARPMLAHLNVQN